jgi:hypothetical protein
MELEIGAACRQLATVLAHLAPAGELDLQSLFRSAVMSVARRLLEVRYVRAPFALITS